MYTVTVSTPIFYQADLWNFLQSFNSLVPPHICSSNYSLASRWVGGEDSDIAFFFLVIGSFIAGGHGLHCYISFVISTFTCHIKSLLMFIFTMYMYGYAIYYGSMCIYHLF